ncbi:MAG TPA: thiamine pyrophosphate-dependent enzyme, partial [Candidatus Sulfotelmatobacter sp.]|nr:thiamine pyrophosphate-dependent enzyme [Candidatus Sulfotelmatobacter sp.]
ITKDAQQTSCDFDWDAAKPQLPGYRPDLSPEQKEYEQALELIHNSKRPVILAGHGIVISGAMREVRDFAERAGIPVAMTLLGIGAFPAAHPLNLGMMGMHGEAWVNHTIQEADLLLAFGMRFDDRVTGNLKTYAPNARKIHIEIDPAEINKNVKVDVPLVGDLREVLHELLPHVESIDRSEWLDYIDKLKGDSAVRDIQNLPDSGHLYAAHVINDLWRETRDAETIVVTDVGQHQMWEAQYYKHEKERSLITSGGLGTMGFALPAAIGAKVARPEAEVWVVVGDGGFQMTLCELATIVQEKLKVNIAIINNGFLGMVRQWQEFFYERNYQATPLLNPDFAKLGEAYGIRSLTVTERSQVVPAVREAREHDGPVLMNFKVEQEDTVYPMVAAGASLHDMIRRPSKIVETAADE